LEEPRDRGKVEPAETLAEFRGNYKYNLLDRNVLAFNAEVPILSQWDDHEVTNNWWPGEPLTPGRAPAQEICREERAAARSAREPRLPRIHADARYFCEPAASTADLLRPLLDIFMLDMRSYRGPNGEGREPATARRLFPRAHAGCLAQARADGFAGDLEGDRRRHADQPGRRL